MQPDLPDLCPGDQIHITNKSQYNSINHSFIPGNVFSTPTIGLTTDRGCTTSSNIITIHHLADICSSDDDDDDDFPCGYMPVEFMQETYETYSSWNYNTFVTVTIPYSEVAHNYLAIDVGGTDNEIGFCGCGHRVAYLGLTFAPKPNKIDDLSVCPDDMINLGLEPGTTYTNWSPSNPDGTSINTTTTYTVDMAAGSGCTVQDEFIIHVNTPSDDPFANDVNFCFDDAGLTLTEDWYWSFSSTSFPKKLVVNGAIVVDDDNGIMNFPYVINGATHGAGVINIEYTYQNFTPNAICKKSYQITIHPELQMDIEDSYAFCDNNFGPICALPWGLGQPGVSYQWTKVGDLFVHSISPCYTPSSYGDYCLKIEDTFGCSVKKCFTVYDPGLDIETPSNITFCSLTGRGPRYIGWNTDPFDGATASYNWSYTDENGTIIPISNTAPYYQVPSSGVGTYTVVVSSGGCTETFSITVIDLLQTYVNHSNAAFSFNPLWGNNVACIPSVTMGAGITENWTVTDQWGNSIPTSSYGTGIRFVYTTGVQYTVRLKRTAYNRCQVFLNEFTWLDGSTRGNRNHRNNISNNITNSSTTTEITTFPNPTTGLVNIKLKNPSTEQTYIQVINALGSVILEKEVNNSSTIELNLSKQTSGIYIVKVINGTDEFTKKVIKQ